MHAGVRSYAQFCGDVCLNLILAVSVVVVVVACVCMCVCVCTYNMLLVVKL